MGVTQFCLLSLDNVNFNVNFNIFLEQSSCAFSWINKRRDNSKKHCGTVKIIEAQQAKLCNTNKNTKLKLLKTNVAIWFKKCAELNI